MLSEVYVGGKWYIKYNGTVIASDYNKVIAYAKARKALGWDH